MKADVQGLTTDLEVTDSLVAVAGLHVVDAGSGAGDPARGLVARGTEVVTREPEPGGQAAINRNELACPSIAFRQTGTETIPCADASMDGVFFAKSWHHVSRHLTAMALQEAIRVLRPDAEFLYILESEFGGSHTELMFPFHDETKARRSARQAPRDVAAPRFEGAREIRFNNRLGHDSHEGLRERVCGQAYAGFRRADVDVPVARGCFELGRNERGDGFDHPMRVELDIVPQRLS
ncbi:MAG: class I SAM-dependent methyltransferase [Rhodospirillales bacterium]|nr:class I SAM-dependent methyltransferase [Rhodospirillales bacterium]